ncbi:glycoside hydrolase family 1 protein [Candidatus Dependentiae bacterium]|jgi:beta-glucosidase|nr:glycoside hydrolase family 1 protein [Candidatus Dependentiae bacterium]
MFLKNNRRCLLTLLFLVFSFIWVTPHAQLKELKKLPNLMGVAWAEFQNSGDTLKDCQWNAWQNFKREGSPTIHGEQMSGKACDHWNRYAEDIKLVKDLGFNACRFSLDWSMIEPEQGQFNQAALDHYHAEIDEMLKHNITPMVTMHHFVHPQWFEELGAFEKLENITIFQSFCVKIFQEFNGKVKLWCTINEPAPFIFQGYINKAFPPGICDLQKAGEVLRNMLIAHVQVYRTLKAMPGGQQAHIGLVHQYLTFEPYNTWNIIEAAPTFFLNYVFNDVILNFLKTGEFSFKIPWLVPVVANVSVTDDVHILFSKLELDRQPYFDFIGLNFYSRVVIQQLAWNVLSEGAVVPSCKDGEVMTDMPYPMYAQGLYEAICNVAQFGVPIYITENGIADAKDDRREIFFRDYLSALSKALEDGYDVRGWFYWSLMDNFEWNDGFTPRFGLYHVDFDTQARTLRPSVAWLQSLLQQRREIREISAP